MAEIGRLKVMMIAPDLGYGGAEKSFAALSNLLAPHYDLHVVVFNREIPQAYPIGGNLLSLDVPTPAGLIGKFRAFRQRVNRTRELKKQLDIDVSISFLEGADYVNLYSRARERVVFSVRGSKRHDPKIRGIIGWFRRSVLLPFCFKRADTIVCVSQGLLNEIARDFQVPDRRLRPIYNFYDKHALGKLAEEPIETELAPLFSFGKSLISVGRMSPEKGFDRLIEVFSRIHKKEPDVKLIFIGDGPYMHKLMERCGALRLQIEKSETGKGVDIRHSVFFLGYRPNPLKYVAKSTLFILPSLTEGFPNAMAEAMVIGVPVAAADCPHGPAELLLNDDQGLLLPSLKPGQGQHQVEQIWAEQVTGLLKNGERRDRYAAANKARMESFSNDAALDHWKKVLTP